MVASDLDRTAPGTEEMAPGTEETAPGTEGTAPGTDVPAPFWEETGAGGLRPAVSDPPALVR